MPQSPSSIASLEGGKRPAFARRPIGGGVREEVLSPRRGGVFGIATGRLHVLGELETRAPTQEWQTKSFSFGTDC